MSWYGLALISAFCIAAVGILEKKTLQREHSEEYVAVFTLIKLGLFLLFFSTTIVWTVTSQQLVILLVDGTIGALAFLAVAKAMKRMELSSAAPLLSLDPGLTAILAFMFLGEHLGASQILGLLLLVAGTYALEVHRGHGDVGQPTTNQFRSLLYPFRSMWWRSGGQFILLGLLLFSVSSTIDRYMLLQVPVTTYVGYTLIANTVIFLTLLIRQRRPLQILRPGKGYILFFITLAAVLHLVSTVSQAKAVGLAAIGLVIAVKRLSVLIDVIIGGRFFHEHHLPQKIAATVLMLAGLFFVVRPT